MVDQRTACRAPDERRDGRCGEDQPRGAEPDAAHVVQVDQQIREDDAVSERVRKAARLKDPHLARQTRIERTEVSAHPSRLQSEAVDARWWTMRPAQSLKPANYVC